MNAEHEQRRRLVVLSVMIVLSGLAVVYATRFALGSIRIFAGMTILIVSALHLAFASPFRAASPVIWQILLSVGYAAMGLYLLGRAAWPLDEVRTPVVAFLIVYGILEIGLFRCSRTHGRILFAVDAIVAGVAALFILRASDPIVAATFAGINIVAGGLSRMLVAPAVQTFPQLR